MLKVFDFRCNNCKEEFEDLVDISIPGGVECALCGSKDTQQILSPVATLTAIIPSYPGCKRMRAGYVHSHGDKVADKAGRQVSVPSKIGNKQ